MPTLQPIVSEMLLGDNWTEVTEFVQRDQGNGIFIQRRPLTWAATVGGTNANWIFKNPDNDFYGRNPNSQFYGLLGRNTRVRHRLRFAYDPFTRSVSNGWGTEPTTGLTWANAGGAASDRTATGSVGQIVLNTLNTSYRDTLALTVLNPRLRTLFKFNAVPTGAAITGGFLARYIDASNYYFTRIMIGTDASVTVEIAKRVAGTNTTLASVVTGITYTANLLLASEFSVEGNYLRARVWRSTDPDPTTWQAVYLDPAPLTTAGGIGVRSQANTGNTNTTPTVSYDNFDYSDYRFCGEIPSFSPQRDKTRRYKTVPVTAAGLSQRLTAGAPTLRSAVTRAMDGITAGSVVPVGHWPMEEPSGATQLGNLRGGGAAIVTGNVTLGGYSGAAGSESVPTLNDGGQISGVFPSDLSLPDASGRSIWQVLFQGTVPSSMAANTTFFDVNVSNAGGDNVVKFRVEWVNATKLLSLRPYTTAGTALTGNAIDFNSNPQLFDKPLLLSIEIYQTSLGGVVSMLFSAYTPNHAYVGAGVNIGAGLTTSLPRPQSWRAYGTSVNSGWSFSHLGYYVDPIVFDQPGQQNYANAIDGFTGEKSGTRQLRLSTEEDINFELIGDENDTNECGPQQVNTYLGLMQQASDTEQGILLEMRDELGLRAITRTALLNTASTVDYSYANSDMESMQTIDDDKTIRNKITARRIGGSFATAEITTGSASTSAPPDGIGVYPEDQSWNLATDTQLGPFAGWRALTKGWDEARYPGTAIWRQRDAIATVPALDTATLALDIGVHYRLTDPPDDLPPDDIDLFVQGYTEKLANFEHELTFDGTPAGPYNVVALDDATYGRTTDDHYLVTAVDTTATAWKIGNSQSGMQLVTDDAQDGWQWKMNGELVTVTDVAPPTIALRGIGAADTGSSGSRHPNLPSGVQIGDLVLIFASTRNSGTGIPQLVVGWDQVYLDGNMALYAAIYNGLGGAFMPTITFSSGAANEDTIAQSAAFSGKFNDTDTIFVRACGCLNASAQNITVPGVPIVGLPENGAALYLGWKQDDYTSVATPSGWTELEEASSTAGNDASQIWGYKTFTSRPAAETLQPALVVTGGAAAISRGAVIVFSSDYQDVTVTRSVNTIVRSHDAGSVPELIPAPHVAM